MQSIGIPVALDGSYVGFDVAVVHSSILRLRFAIRHIVFVVVQDRNNHCAFILMSQPQKRVPGPHLSTSTPTRGAVSCSCLYNPPEPFPGFKSSQVLP